MMGIVGELMLHHATQKNGFDVDADVSIGDYLQLYPGHEEVIFLAFASSQGIQLVTRYYNEHSLHPRQDLLRHIAQYVQEQDTTSLVGTGRIVEGIRKERHPVIPETVLGGNLFWDYFCSSLATGYAYCLSREFTPLYGTFSLRSIFSEEQVTRFYSKMGCTPEDLYRLIPYTIEYVKEYTFNEIAKEYKKVNPSFLAVPKEFCTNAFRYVAYCVFSEFDD